MMISNSPVNPDCVNTYYSYWAATYDQPEESGDGDDEPVEGEENCVLEWCGDCAAELCYRDVCYDMEQNMLSCDHYA